jgi:fermentation-respiration switch protein FrsA (DUF1100 family)
MDMTQANEEAAFLTKLSGPARSALLHENVTSLEKLAAYSEKEILALHGVGPASLPTMRQLLAEQGYAFKVDQS